MSLYIKEHNISICGLCYHRKIMSDIAKKLLKDGTTKNAIKDWDKEVRDKWQQSKYYKLYQKALKNGLDPNVEFAKKGWEM